jgi:hypothetical protein
MKMRKHGNAKVENAETWKCKMYFMMSRLGHCSMDDQYLLYKLVHAASFNKKLNGNFNQCTSKVVGWNSWEPATVQSQVINDQFS